MREPPYRHELRTVSEADLAVMIRDQRAEGALAIEPVDVSLERIAATKLAHSDRATAWGGHPDERVAMAMLDAHQTRRIFGHRAADRIDPLIRAQIKRAQADGLVWTPVLDEISRRGLWHNHRAPAKHDEWISQLAPWISSRTDTTEILDLLRFRAPAIASQVAVHARTLDDRVIDRLLAEPEAVYKLAENPSAGPEHLARIRDWLLSCLDPRNSAALSQGRASIRLTFQALRKRGWEPDDAFVDRLLEVAGPTQRKYELRDLGVRLLLDLGERIPPATLVGLGSIGKLQSGLVDAIIQRAGDNEALRRELARQTVSTHHFDRLLECGLWKYPDIAEKALRSESPSTLAILIDPSVPAEISESAFSRMCDRVGQLRKHGYPKLFWDLLLQRAFTDAQLHRLYELTRGDREASCQLIRHHAAGPLVWRAALEEGGTILRNALASHEPARLDPVVRQALLRSGAPDIVHGLALDGRPGEFPALISKLAARRDRRVLDLLAAAPDAALARVDRKALTPWLTSDDRDQRTRAILLISRLGGRPAARQPR